MAALRRESLPGTSPRTKPAAAMSVRRIWFAALWGNPNNHLIHRQGQSGDRRCFSAPFEIFVSTRGDGNRAGKGPLESLGAIPPSSTYPTLHHLGCIIAPLRWNGNYSVRIIIPKICQMLPIAGTKYRMITCLHHYELGRGRFLYTLFNGLLRLTVHIGAAIAFGGAGGCATLTNDLRRVLSARSFKVLLLGCLLIPAGLASTLTCQQTGPNTILITEPGLVPGAPEPVNEVNACTLPAGVAAPAVPVFFDMMEPSPGDPLLPVSDYFDVTDLGIVTLTSDPLETGLPLRPLIATPVAEVAGPGGSDGAVITVAGVTYDIVSDSGGGANVPEPASALLLLTAIVLLAEAARRNRNRLV